MIDKSTIQQVLGGLIKHPQYLSQSDKYQFQINDFSNRFEKMIYVAIYNLYQNGARKIQPIDIENYFEENAFRITRKGGNKSVLYFNDEVKVALMDWMQARSKIKELPVQERALFVSLQNKRISVRAVEKLVKKYAGYAAPLKKITPHKLRSTYGTNLYRETNDIYVVASVLGHKDVNTTRKHYAAMTEDIRREAATKVKLRKD